ncbi:MAG: hypothetical protein ACC645_24155 [Pirellulales bacterium]
MMIGWAMAMTGSAGSQGKARRSLAGGGGVPRDKRAAALSGGHRMTKGQSTNVSASVKQRLLNLARERGEEFNLVLIRYGIERFLYRLSQSAHADAFVLKGAMLFQLFAEVH